MSDVRSPTGEQAMAPLVLKGLESFYDQVRLMAIGGMAEVYRGRQKSLDRPVAIKRIRPELKQNRDLQERFKREAKSSANLLHQNLAHVYDYQVVQDEAYIIMEWIDGFDLAEVIEKIGALPVDVAAIIALKILSGLSYVHSHGMVHRDIKPDNVRMSTRGEVKIMDFGIAFDPTESNLTQPGTLIGSPHYLSPEQIIGLKIDARVDLFSFGITFYEMLTGKKPFFETQTESVYERIKRGDYISPENIRPEVPGFIVKLLSSCLEVKAARRPANADQVSAALQQFVASTFTNDHEPRLRQFLVQSGIMGGKHVARELDEKTGPNLTGPQKKSYKKLLVAIISIFGAAVVTYALIRLRR